MTRYPYTLEVWCQEESTQDLETGSWSEGTACGWRVAGRCNIHQNGQARTVRGQDGAAFIYSYQLSMRYSTPPVAFDTRIRVYDRNGINYFDDKPRNEDAPDLNTSRTYPVRGFDPGSQKNQDVTIWL